MSEPVDRRVLNAAAYRLQIGAYSQNSKPSYQGWRKLHSFLLCSAACSWLCQYGLQVSASCFVKGPINGAACTWQGVAGVSRTVTHRGPPPLPRCTLVDSITGADAQNKTT